MEQKGWDYLSKEKLSWAFPMESTGIVEYPLLNEVVIVVKYLDKLFYTRKLNLNGFINQESNFRLEKFYGNNDGNKDLVSEDGLKTESVEGPLSLNSFKKISNNQVKGVLGSYFLANSKIRKLRRYEGDTVLESRHGQSIRFSAYDDIRENDKGFVYTKDISSNDIDGIFQIEEPEIVIHLASFPRQKVVNANPALGSRTMSEGLLNLLEHSDKYEVRKFIYISSSMVYGDFTDDVTEEPLKGIDCVCSDLVVQSTHV